MTMPAAIPAPQAAVVSMLQTAAAIDFVLQRDTLVRLQDIPEIAAHVGLDRAGIAPDDYFEWLREGLTGADEAAVLVFQREPWLDAIRSLPETADEFPVDLVVAATIDVPYADRCLVVPKGGGKDLADSVMLFAERRLDGLSIFEPIAAWRGSSEAKPWSQRCQLSADPNLACFSSGCAGTCVPRVLREGGVLICTGCICR